MKFWLSQNLLFKAKTYAASRESNIELLIIVSDFMANSRLKILYGISMEFIECLNTRMHRKKKKKGHFLYIKGRIVLITTDANLLDTKYEFYGFNVI